MKLSLLLFLTLINYFSIYAQVVISPDNNFTYKIPYNNEFNFDLLNKVKRINPYIIDIRILKTKQGNKPIAISKYEGDENLPIETILKKYVNSVKPYENSKVVESRTYKKNGILFYRKISILNIDNHNETINIIYYFKESIRSKYLYELKLSSNLSDSSKMKKYLERIASTVTFKK
jgi:hypothetical protein